MQVVGLVGYIASGKSTISTHFVDRGFVYYKLSDAIREECLDRDLPITRVNLQNVGNELREKHGGAVLAQRVLELAKNNDQVVIDGVRNPEEVEYLRQHSEAFILGVVAPQYVRMQRYLERASDRGEDGVTKVSFLRANQREKGVGEEESGQQVEACLELVDHTIHNTGSLDDLLLSCEELIQSNFFNGEIPVI